MAGNQGDVLHRLDSGSGGSGGGDASATNQVVIQNLTDQLAHIINQLRFLSALQSPTSELRVTINGGTALVSSTLGAVTTLTNQTSLGGYNASMAVMNQINTNVGVSIRSQIITT